MLFSHLIHSRGDSCLALIGFGGYKVFLVDEKVDHGKTPRFPIDAARLISPRILTLLVEHKILSTCSLVPRDEILYVLERRLNTCLVFFFLLDDKLIFFFEIFRNFIEIFSLSIFFAATKKK